MRTCSRCRTSQPEESFRWQPTVQRRHAWCRSCERAARQQRTSSRSARRSGVRPQVVLADRAFGVEIEFQGNRWQLHAAMQAEGLPCEVQDYNHRDSATTWKIVPDMSVLGGAELVSPILRGTDGFEQLRKATRALQASGCKPNKSCGLHVHHDARDLTAQQIAGVARMYARHQQTIDFFVAPSRRGNTYAKRMDERYLSAIEAQGLSGLSQMAAMDRFHAVNALAYPRHGTVEFRQHQGTVNFSKMASWIRLGQSMVRAAVEARNVSDLLSDLDLADGDRDFFTGRRAVFARRAGVAA